MKGREREKDKRGEGSREEQRNKKGRKRIKEGVWEKQQKKKQLL